MAREWSVSVAVNGAQILWISSNDYGGKTDLTNEDEEIIRTAAEHLLSFVGRVHQDTGKIDSEVPF